MSGKKRFSSVDVALTGVFCALWAVLNLTLGPLSVQLLGLPLLHDFAVFFTLLLAVWVTGKFGVASLVGTIGSVLALALGMPFVVLGFACASVVFDLLMTLNHNTINLKAGSLAVTCAATSVSASFAGLIIAVFILRFSWFYALSFWAVWHLVGGVFALAVTLPLLGILEKANVRAMKL